MAFGWWRDAGVGGAVVLARWWSVASRLAYMWHLVDMRSAGAVVEGWWAALGGVTGERAGGWLADQVPTLLGVRLAAPWLLPPGGSC
ncbi:hypothetical protein FRACA_1160018 [Frankia canadensis]|uniref:Uncharacterized protein n=1 Tax=Frankia canadensis TaxID=1836972 RepID=A0A2I2KJR0_9ACTN|nr:hypothetical protein FRACA_1160018 [Frankia canadensis]SOU53174.1 hypothetical protein FRACA_1160018 [Frankia canadensis]